MFSVASAEDDDALEVFRERDERRRRRGAPLPVAVLALLPSFDEFDDVRASAFRCALLLFCVIARLFAAQNCSMEFSAMVAAFSAVLSAAITHFSHGLLHLAMVKTATERS